MFTSRRLTGMTTPKSARRAGAAAVTTALLAGLCLTGATGAAHAAGPCDSRSVKNNSDSSAVFTKLVSLKTAPASECSNATSKATTYDGFYLWCYVNNSYGNEWVYGRIEGTNLKGWTSLANLSSPADGSLNHC